MSAPTALESGALVRGIAWYHQPRPARSSADAVPAEVERRTAAPVAVLSRQHDDLCRQASDPLEIAAVLESAGLTDSLARSAYRAPGVFDVAEQLWTRVPWRPEADRPRRDLWHLPLWRSQLRGVLYAVPAVVAAVIPAQLSGGLDYAVLTVATAVAIAATQALSVLGHVLTGRGQTRALAQLVGLALAASLAVGALATVACVLAGRPVALGLAPGGQLVFVVAATLLMVGGRDRLLLALIAPGALVVALSLLPATAMAPWGLEAAGALTVVLAAAGAWLRLGRTADGDAPTDGDTLRRAVGAVELSHAGVAGLYGLGLSALVTYAVVGVAAGRVAAPGGWLLLATVPLTATVGASEYALHRARSRATASLADAAELSGFTAAARRHLRAMVAGHAGVVGAVCLVVLGVLRLADVDAGARAVLTGYTVGYAVLGVALLLTTTLISVGYSGLAAALAGSVGVLLVGSTLFGVHGQQLVLTQVAVMVMLVAVAYRVTERRFVTVSVHR